MTKGGGGGGGGYVVYKTLSLIFIFYLPYAQDGRVKKFFLLYLSHLIHRTNVLHRKLLISQLPRPRFEMKHSM